MDNIIEANTKTSIETSAESSAETVTGKAACEEWEYRFVKIITKHLIRDVNEFIKDMEHLIPKFREYVQSLSSAIDGRFEPHKISIAGMLLSGDLYDLIELGRRIHSDAERLHYLADCMAVRDCYEDGENDTESDQEHG